MRFHFGMNSMSSLFARFSMRQPFVSIVSKLEVDCKRSDTMQSLAGAAYRKPVLVFSKNISELVGFKLGVSTSGICVGGSCKLRIETWRR